MGCRGPRLCRRGAVGLGVRVSLCTPPAEGRGLTPAKGAVEWEKLRAAPQWRSIEAVPEADILRSRAACHVARGRSGFSTSRPSDSSETPFLIVLKPSSLRAGGGGRPQTGPFEEAVRNRRTEHAANHRGRVVGRPVRWAVAMGSGHEVGAERATPGQGRRG